MFSKQTLRKQFLALLALGLLALAGCGDLKGNKVVKSGPDVTRFRANCQLDVNEFSKIMYQTITSQIRCLKENLQLFMRVVESGKKGYLSRVALEKYILSKRPDIKPEVVRALKSVFEVSFLVTGDNPEFISKENVDKILEFVEIFNIQAALNFRRTFENDQQTDFVVHQIHRGEISSASKTVVMAMRQIFKNGRNGEVHKIDIMNLLESFTTDENRHIIEKAKKLLFVKKVLLGGQKVEISHIELERLLHNFEQLLLIAFDLVRYKYIKLDQSSILQLVQRDVNELSDILHKGPSGNRDQEVLFDVDESIEAVKLFVDKETLDVDKFRNMVLEAKMIVMGGNPDVVKGIELRKLFDHGKSLLQTGTLFHNIYKHFEGPLEAQVHQPVSINFDEYRHSFPSQQQELSHFERVVKKYRFLKGRFESAYYSRAYRRNSDSIFEVALIEYALKLVFQTFGRPTHNTVGGYSIHQDEMRNLVKKFETDLIELGLIMPQRAINVADNISLLGTLFQYQSDKNQLMDINEGTEFALSLFTSMTISKNMMTYFKGQNCKIDQFERVEPVCFKKHFFPAFCHYNRNHYPLLFDSIGTPKKCEDIPQSVANMEFLDRSIKAARVCNYYPDGQKEEIFYSEGDVMNILLAKIHAETTVIRWDTNRNNILDPDEVDKAYDIYGPALDAFLEDKPAIVKKFKKQIYQYLIKYEEIPDEKKFSSTMKFIKFLISFNKKSTANRKTISSVLWVIGEETQKLAQGPKFNCKWLRDPDNIPREAQPLIESDPQDKSDFSHLLKDYLEFADD